MSEPVIAALLIGFFSGVVAGFLISPIKKGISIGSNNICTNYEAADEEEQA